MIATRDDLPWAGPDGVVVCWLSPNTASCFIVLRDPVSSGVGVSVAVRWL